MIPGEDDLAVSHPRNCMSPKKTIGRRTVGSGRAPARPSEETAATDWDASYQRRIRPWSSTGLGLAEHLLKKTRRRGVLLEIGCGTGRDALALRKLGFQYEGLDLSSTAVGKARRQLSCSDVEFHIADFFYWKPKKAYAMVYEKGVLHGLEGLRLRRLFARRVSSALAHNGIWITIAGAADYFDRRYPRPAVLLTHLAEAVEPYFEILEVQKGSYGVPSPSKEFDAWYCCLRKRSYFPR